MNESRGLVGPSVVSLFADGESAQVDSTVRFYGKGSIELGEGSRIDAFCVITVGPKGVKIGKNVHIGCGVYIFGAAGRVEIGDRCSLSPRVTIYTETDDFTVHGGELIGPTNPRHKRKTYSSDIELEENVALATAAIVLPSRFNYKHSLPRGYRARAGAVLCE